MYIDARVVLLRKKRNLDNKNAYKEIFIILKI